MNQMFSVGYGSKNREVKIRGYIAEDFSVAVILAAVHFEWMLKRTIMKLGKSSTKELRKELKYRFILKSNDKKSLIDLWNDEIKIKNGAFGKVIGNLAKIKTVSVKMRGHIIHGNGLVKKADALSAIDEYLKACEKLRLFVIANGHDIDKRLKPRL
jgi:hypothetical protein